MIFLSFILCVALFLVFAAFAGNVFTFINIDSIVIVLLGFVVSSLAVAVGRYRLYLEGLKQIFRFKSLQKKSSEVKNMVGAVAIMTNVVGIGSTAQGLISAVLIENNTYSLGQILSFASFTTIYSIIFTGLLLVPIIYLNKE